ncbi:MAG: hypothetical protein WC271_16795, partial [Bacteroidales bacterium]
PRGNCLLRRDKNLLQRKSQPFMDPSSPAGYLFSSQQLHSEFSCSHHKNGYPKASAFSIQFVLTYLLPFS